MSVYTATIKWTLDTNKKFIDNKYSRAHIWAFDGGTIVPASASPSVVPIPYSVPNAVDPEEAFVASVSSCHMLWFLSLAAQRGFCVHEYTDDASGMMGRNDTGRIAILRVDLAPLAIFSGENRPTPAEIDTLHHLAHEKCFIANSVTSKIVCTPRYA